MTYREEFTEEEEKSPKRRTPSCGIGFFRPVVLGSRWYWASLSFPGRLGWTRFFGKVERMYEQAHAGTFSCRQVCMVAVAALIGHALCTKYMH